VAEEQNKLKTDLYVFVSTDSPKTTDEEGEPGRSTRTTGEEEEPKTTDDEQSKSRPSISLTNIWAGIGAGLWAVSEAQALNIKGQATKAARLPIGACGILYCKELKCFTTPFLVCSKPSTDKVNDQHIEKDVWSEYWYFPFRILPLGSPRKRVETKDLGKYVKAIADGEPWTNVLRVIPATVFNPCTKVTQEDWAKLFDALVESPERFSRKQ